MSEQANKIAASCNKYEVGKKTGTQMEVKEWGLL
jgi:hypothetical protein